MFIKNSKGQVVTASPITETRRRGRPRGTTDQGVETRWQLYKTAIALIASGGYEATTLRDIAKKADVSVGLLYRYFPSKRAVVLALYDELSAEYAARASEMEPGPWHARFVAALKTSLGVLAPQRDTLAALTSVLVGDANEGLFAPATEFSRQRVQAVFERAVQGASDAPSPHDAAALGRLLYLVHLAVVLWWLLDKSPEQRTTKGLITLLERLLPVAAQALRFDTAWAFVHAADLLGREGLFGEGESPTPKSGR